MDDRLQIAKDMMIELLRADLRGRFPERTATEHAAAARCLADALLLELHKVPAPSGGPAPEIPPSVSKSPTSAGSFTDSYGGALPRTPEAK